MADSRSTADVDDGIAISVPLKMERGATVRLLAAAMGADAGFSVDEIDDLKLAVSEVFSTLVETGDDVDAARVHVRYLPIDGGIRVELHRGVDADHITFDPLASTILSSVVDEHTVTPAGVSIVKRRREFDV